FPHFKISCQNKSDRRLIVSCMISGVPKTVPPSVPPSPPQYPPRRDRERIRTGLPWFLRNISEPYVCNTKKSKGPTQKPRFQGRDGSEPSPPPGSPENRSAHSVP